MSWLSIATKPPADSMAKFNASQFQVPQQNNIQSPISWRNQPYGGLGTRISKTSGDLMPAAPGLQRRGTIEKPILTGQVTELIGHLHSTTQTSQGKSAWQQLENRVGENIDHVWNKEGPVTYQSLLKLQPNRVTSELSSASDATHALLIHNEKNQPEHFFGLNELSADQINQAFMPSAISKMLDKYNFQPSKLKAGIDISPEINDAIGRFSPQDQQKLIDEIAEFIK